MWFYYVLVGFCSGIIGGMGMGGGTLLIPMLTIFLGVTQHTAQGINLLVFIPMGIVAIIIHIVNKLIDYKVFFMLVLPAIITSVLSSNLSNNIPNTMLKLIFGIFLIVIAIYEIIVAIYRTVKAKKPILKNKI